VILGLLSDTHGRAAHTAAALHILRDLGAEAFIHCGDIGEVCVLDELAGTKSWIVCGNTDQADAHKLAYAASLGLQVVTVTPLRLELCGRFLAVFHGHEMQFTRLVNETLESGQLPAEFGPCDYILYGHTHVASEGRLGSARLINPGALYRAPIHTVATLDLRSDIVRFWQVCDSECPTPHEVRPRR
jgi:putative phosphoesterase